MMWCVWWPTCQPAFHSLVWPISALRIHLLLSFPNIYTDTHAHTNAHGQWSLSSLWFLKCIRLYFLSECAARRIEREEENQCCTSGGCRTLLLPLSVEACRWREREREKKKVGRRWWRNKAESERMKGWMSSFKYKAGLKNIRQRKDGSVMNKVSGESSAWLCSMSAVTTCSSKR